MWTYIWSPGVGDHHKYHRVQIWIISLLIWQYDKKSWKIIISNLYNELLFCLNEKNKKNKKNSVVVLVLKIEKLLGPIILLSTIGTFQICMYVCMYVCMHPTYLVNYERGTTTTLLPFSLYPNLFSLFIFSLQSFWKGMKKKVFDLPHLNRADRTTMTLGICLLYLPITSAIIAYKTTSMCWIAFFFKFSL